VFSFVVIAIFAALITTKVGSHFLYASGNLFYTADPKNVLPVAPFFGFFVALASGSAIFIWIAFIMFFCWYIMLAPNAPLGATRIMLAMANDKVLPDWFGRVNARSHTPVNSILVFSAICVGVCALYAYATWFVPLTVALVIPSLTAFGVTMVAAILFPKRRSGLYKATPGDKHRLFGIPIMSICAVVFLAFVIFIDYECLTNDTLAINTTKGLVFVGGMYAASFALYFGSKYYRKRKEHFDLGVVYQELPAE
jgi:amino acid transporter